MRKLFPFFFLRNFVQLNNCSRFHSRSEEKEKAQTIQTEIDATKKEAQKEMERNETLEHLKQRMVDNMNRMDKQSEFRFAGEKMNE